MAGRPFVLEPSARVFALWEHENAYTDSLGTLQTERNFSTGRASGGVKVSYPLAWSSTTNLRPTWASTATIISQGTMRRPSASPPCRSCKDGRGAQREAWP